jgi:hypothetical protein
MQIEMRIKAKSKWFLLFCLCYTEAVKLTIFLMYFRADTGYLPKICARTAAGRAAPGMGKTSNRLGRSAAAGRIQQSKGVLVHAGAGGSAQAGAVRRQL